MGLHTAAAIWWALFYEGIFGRTARRSAAGALGGGAAIAALAYVVDYHVVHRRFRPGFETYLSPAGMVATYAALGIGYAATAALSGLGDHEVEDGDEGTKRRPAEREPDAVVAPE